MQPANVVATARMSQPILIVSPTRCRSRQSAAVLEAMRISHNQSYHLANLGLSRYPFLDHSAGRHPASAEQGGPCAADRFTSDIGTLLPIALCVRTALLSTPISHFPIASSRLMNQC